jgi:hypothetical protein
LSILNEGPADPITATLIHAFDSPDALASAEGTDCHPLDGGVLTCVVREVRIGSPIVQELLVTVSPDYSGTLTNTITLTGTQQAININPDNSRPIAIRLEPPPMFPAFARVAYVQSHRASHELGLVDSNGRLIDPSLHLYAAAPAWSPGGNEIAFFGEPGINQLGSLFNQGNGIWIINARGNSPRQLVAVDHVQNIAWSLDGTKLAFEVANPPDIAHEIRVVDAKGGIEISRFPGQQPAWRPDSQKLAVRNCTVSNGLCLVNFDGSGAQALTTQGKDSYPAWSPDGQYLAFTSERHNGWEIYLLRLADRQVERVTNRAGSDVTPVFGPNSRDLYLRTDAYGDWRITVWNLETERELTVRKDVGPSDDWGLARPAVH